MAVLEDEKILVEEEESEGPRTTRNYQIFRWIQAFYYP